MRGEADGRVIVTNRVTHTSADSFLHYVRLPPSRNNPGRHRWKYRRIGSYGMEFAEALTTSRAQWPSGRWP